MTDTFFNILLMILGFGILIFVHELGHFLAAKWAGIRTEAFAIGMGTPVVSWRKGIGFAWGSTEPKVVKAAGKPPRDLSLSELASRGIGCTEYSLRWLPIGGFVKMLGQDDADPGYVSNEPGSYNVCPIPKRMVVVSAGVIANMIFAVLLFVIAFMVGVQSYPAVVGGVLDDMPAATAVAENAEALGISEPGLRPGDEITEIDGEAVRTFVDVRIAGAMARPDRALLVEVRRPGVPEPLLFPIVPQKGAEGLLGIGVEPGRSSTLIKEDRYGALPEALGELGLGDLQLGMTMVEAAGRPIETYEQFQAAARRLDGEPVPTTWRFLDAEGNPAGATVQADVPVRPTYEILRYAEPIPGVEQNAEHGLIGLTPLIRVAQTEGGHNADVLQPGDLILRAGATDGPRSAQFRRELTRRAGGEIELRVQRGDEIETVTAEVNRKGMLGIAISLAWDVPLTAQPMARVHLEPGPDGAARDVHTPVQPLALMGRTRIDAVNDTPVTDWPALREALRGNTRTAFESGREARITLTTTNPTPGREQETNIVTLSSGDVARLHELSWYGDMPDTMFEPLRTVLTAAGNPIRAAVLGFQETWKVVVMTYLTIDRLLRGSVSVETIRGPVGIVHIGAQVADRGFMYLLFFLGIISVNLAVINFLPIPIVDGGLFLFLIYEKLKGRPPSLAFQNAATIVGVALIATVLLVVTWNDLVRLAG